MDPEQFQFRVVGTKAQTPWQENTIYLVEDQWDDWFRYSTMYQVILCAPNQINKRLGSIKIGQFNMQDDQRRPNLPSIFKNLDPNFFSLGQDADYYANLNKLGETLRKIILMSLSDVAADLDLWERVKSLDVTKESLLRSVTKNEVKGQFHRIAQGGAKLTDYVFTYIGPKRDTKGESGIKLSFEVEPESFPPTNVHVVIGRNGVGKTHTMNLMTKALVAKRAVAAQSGSFTTTGGTAGAPFSNLVLVCFSAFDSFLLGPDEIDKNNNIAFSYIGLRRFDEDSNKIAAPKSPDRLATEFVNSAINCSMGSRSERWHHAVETLETDPIFAAAQVGGFIEGLLTARDKQIEVRKIFKRLSSGHQIVLLTITRLVEVVEEKTLVLLDEPEGHLHPPLLSAFIRALSDLLIDRNGVAIIATHSPVVLQEVPRSCVWKLQRSGVVAVAERPDCQTFGENVGILTKEVFGFEVTDAGFHRILRGVVEKTPTFEQAIKEFGGELGAEARAILNVMYLRKEAKNEEIT